MISLRRDSLDSLLKKHKSLMKGNVLDIGGKKNEPRGSFRPPHNNVKSWKYLNIDEKTKPDYHCDLNTIPLRDNSIDTIIMMEVLEYIPNPEKAFAEIYRVLNYEGHIIFSFPFLSPMHGDYWLDRARYTPVMIEEMVLPLGYKIILIESMGSVGSVIYDIIRASFGYASKKGYKLLFSKVLVFISPLFRFIDYISKTQKKYINTGYFVTLKKERT